MTHDEMNDVINAFCSDRDGCEDCAIHHLCDPIKGIFSQNEEPTKEAFKIIKSLQPDKKENVNHPSHYNQGKYECIDVMVETFGSEVTQHFCALNAFKYIWRSREKGGVADLEKALWYLKKFLELEGASDD